MVTDERVKRKLAAILALDVVGFSKLMHSDDLAAFDLVQRLGREVFSPLIEDCDGIIFKHTGDGVLARFDSVHDAFEAAELIIAAIVERGEASVRIGIHLGDIIASDGDVFGDSVNIACRLESIALQNGICVSERAWSDLRQRRVQFRDLGQQKLKNIETPIRVFMFDPSGAKAPIGATLRRTIRKPAMLAMALAGLLGVGALWFFLSNDQPEDSEAVLAQSLAATLDAVPCSWLRVESWGESATRSRAVIEGYSNLPADRVQGLALQGLADQTARNIEVDASQIAAIPDYNCAFVDAASEFKYHGISRAELVQVLRTENPQEFGRLANKLPDDVEAIYDVRIFTDDFSDNAHLFVIDEADGLQALARVADVDTTYEDEAQVEGGLVHALIFSDQTSPGLFFIVDGSQPVDPEQVVGQLDSLDDLRNFRQAAQAGGWQFELILLGRNENPESRN